MYILWHNQVFLAKTLVTFCHSLPSALALKDHPSLRDLNFKKNQNPRAKVNSTNSVLVEFQAAIESGASGLLPWAFGPSASHRTIKRGPRPRILSIPFFQSCPSVFRTRASGPGPPPPAPEPPRGRQRALLSRRLRRGRLGVWPGLGIFVLFKCQRLLLTLFPNMFLICPVFLLREKL